MRCPNSSLRRGITLVEMIISIPLVGIALVAALNTVGAAKFTQFKISVSRQGHLLAQDLMSEILVLDYQEPLDTPGFGQESSEDAGDRTAYDDVDDYNGWSSTPPEYRNDTEIANSAAWERSVTVVWANPLDVSQVVVSEQGVKRITVTVKHNGIPVAELVALKTVGLPSLEGCCFGDGSCEDLRVEACAALGGTAQGPDVSCAATACPIEPKILFVVTDDAAPTAQELARLALMESWDSPVVLIAASAAQSYFDAAVANADAAYVSEAIVAADLGSKLTDTPIGVVNEDPDLVTEFGFSAGYDADSDGSQLHVANNAHYITTPFTVGELDVYSSSPLSTTLSGGNALGLQVLMTRREQDEDEEVLNVLDTGARMFGSGGAAGRRVQLPWGQPGFDFNELTAAGRTIMKRAIRWAAGMEFVCGDNSCDVGEECTCPVDCGVPTVFEQPGVDCDDRKDNDCDGTIDCADVNCPTDPACLDCGDAVCEVGEDCIGCPTDCSRLNSGPSSGRYCCGNGVAEAAESDGSICDGNY